MIEVPFALVLGGVLGFFAGRDPPSLPLIALGVLLCLSWLARVGRER